MKSHRRSPPGAPLPDPSSQGRDGSETAGGGEGGGGLTKR